MGSSGDRLEMDLGALCCARPCDTTAPGERPHPFPEQAGAGVQVPLCQGPSGLIFRVSPTSPHPIPGFPSSYHESQAGWGGWGRGRKKEALLTRPARGCGRLVADGSSRVPFCPAAGAWLLNPFSTHGPAVSSLLISGACQAGALWGRHCGCGEYPSAHTSLWVLPICLQEVWPSVVCRGRGEAEEPLHHYAERSPAT